MTDTEINQTIAEYIGYKPLPICTDMTGKPFDGWDEPPNYCGDLNKMHEAEKALRRTCEPAPHMVSERLGYADILKEQTGSAGAIFATARQRAEAFLKTIGKWKE